MLPKAIGLLFPLRPLAHALSAGAAKNKKCKLPGSLSTTANFLCLKPFWAPWSYSENLETIALPVPEFLADK